MTNDTLHTTDGAGDNGHWSRWMTEGIAAALTLAVAAAAFTLSFHALSDLGRLSGVVPPSLSALLPITVDVFMLQATVCTVAASARHDAVARRYHTRMLTVFALASVAGNAWHALVVGYSGPLTGAGAAVIAVVAPLALLASTHGLVVHLWAGRQMRSSVEAPDTTVLSSDEEGSASHAHSLDAEVEALSADDVAASDPDSTAEPVCASATSTTVSAVDAQITAVDRELARAVCAQGRVTKPENEVARALALSRAHWTPGDIAPVVSVHRTTVARWLDLAHTITAAAALDEDGGEHVMYPQLAYA